MKNRVLFGLWLFAAAAVSLGGQARSAELSIVGTGDGLELLRAIAVEYTMRHPEVKISIPASIGSGGGIAAVASGTERLGRVARKLTQTEAEAGIVYLPIARIPSAIFAHPSAGVTDLPHDAIVRIFTGEADSWTEFGGANIPIKVVRREEADSTLIVLRESMPGWADLEFTDRSKTAVTTQESIQTVRDVAGAIGFGPYSRVLDFETTVLRVDGKFPTDPDYPSAVELALIYRDGTLEDDMKSLIDFCRSEEAARIIKTYGGVPIGS